MPFPADRGGKADVWRRLQAFRELGVQVQLIHWPPGGAASLDTAGRQALSETVSECISLAPRRSLARIPPWDLLRVPFQITKFRPDPETFAAVAGSIRSFGSRAIWIEGPWTAEPGRGWARHLGLPLVYRSHNIEHLYMPGQARATRQVGTRWAIRLSNLHLRRLEFATMRASRAVFDISNDDLLWWRGRGIGHNTWLPPVSEAAFRTSDPPSEPDLDVLFLGNLVSPNNLRGVEWLLDSVWPIVRAARPQARLAIAGSGPSEALRRKVDATGGAILLGNVPDALAVLRRARVHANPVLTGSGVQLKTVEMLMTSAPVVSTPQGMSGLPDWIRDDVSPTFDPGEFAHRIVAHLERPWTETDARRRCRSLFSVHALDPVVELLAKIPDPSGRAT